MKLFYLFSIILICKLGEAQEKFYNLEKIDAFLEIDTLSHRVSGLGKYTFKILKHTDSLIVDAKQMEIVWLKKPLKGISSYYNKNKLIIKGNFTENQNHTFEIQWETIPQKALYFVGWDNQAPNQIWTQGQGKDNSHWIPVIDNVNFKSIFELTIKFNKKYQVISNGKLIKKTTLVGSSFWHYKMNKPMSSYLLALVIGKYEVNKKQSKSGVPLYNYYYTQGSNLVEPTYRYGRKIFNLLENKIGVPYPWQNYKQIPVHDFLYAGMENTGTTIFSDFYITDSIAFKDRNYIHIQSHELAHQWFGNLVTAKESNHHWLQEGFASFYTLWAEKNILGDEHFYFKYYEKAEDLALQNQTGSTSLINPKSSSLTFYWRGAWTLFALQDKIGTQNFDESIVQFLNKYKYSNVTTEQFLEVVEKVSGASLVKFKEKWISSKRFPYKSALKLLKEKSVFIHEYFMSDCQVYNSRCQYLLKSGISDEAKRKVIRQIPQHLTKGIFKNSKYVRQEIANSLTNIPKDYKVLYESLLNDDSYLTKEWALINLWKNFPASREKYLNQTQGIIGFKDKSFRMAWLTLALLTPNYASNQKNRWLNELTSYSNADFSYYIRQHAFQYLQFLNACHDVCKQNLKQASNHHFWQFKNFAEKLILKL